jgi:hypothetical protein
MDESSNPRRVSFQRLRALTSEHPVLVLAGAAAVAALAGVELATGALVGIGAAALFGTEEGRSMRRKLVDRGRGMFHRRDEQEAPATPPPAAP